MPSKQPSGRQMSSPCSLAAEAILQLILGCAVCECVWASVCDVWMCESRALHEHTRPLNPGRVTETQMQNMHFRVESGPPLMSGLVIHKNISVSVTKLTHGLREGFINFHLLTHSRFTPFVCSNIQFTSEVENNNEISFLVRLVFWT